MTFLFSLQRFETKAVEREREREREFLETNGGIGDRTQTLSGLGSRGEMRRGKSVTVTKRETTISEVDSPSFLVGETMV